MDCLSESVTEGHPDKVADQISDAILDYVMAHDPMGRVACETLVTTGVAVVAGEITTKTHIDYPKIVRETVEGIVASPLGAGDAIAAGAAVGIRIGVAGWAKGVATTPGRGAISGPPAVGGGRLLDGPCCGSPAAGRPPPDAPAGGTAV